jgi:tetratricopeptide (TPR) repeat protein
MDDIARAREQLLVSERARPGPGQDSFYWEDGLWWQQTFEELKAAERAFDAVYTAETDNAQSGTHIARRRMLLAETIKERADWYHALCVRLQNAEQAWGTDKRGRSLAPASLHNHIAQVDTQIKACEVRYALLTLEYLEQRRRERGGLDKGTWQAAWNEVCTAFRAQDACAQCWYGENLLAESTRFERLSALERIRHEQTLTRQEWGNRRDVATSALEADSRTVDRHIENLRLHGGRASNSRLLPAVGAFGAVGLVVVLLMLAGRSSGQQSGAPATAATTPQPTPLTLQGNAQAVRAGEVGGEPAAVPAAAVSSPEAEQHNAAGLELFRAERYEEALAAFDQAIGVAPAWSQPYNNKAFCLYELGQYEAALQAWLLAIDLNYLNADAFAGAGLAFATLGQQAEGQRYYDRALAIEPRYRDAAWMRAEHFWTERAIAASAVLRGEGGLAPTIYIPPKVSP